MSVTLNIEHLDLPDLGQLYDRNLGEESPNDAFVQMTEYGEVTADYSGLPNAFEPDVHYKRVLRWKVPSEVNGQALFKTLNSEPVTELLQRVYVGYSVDWVWDKGCNDEIKVGTLDEDAQAAFDVLTWIFSEVECDEVGPIDEFLDANDDLHLYWPSGPIEEGVKNLQAAAAASIPCGSAKGALLNFVSSIFHSYEPGLNSDHLAALIECGWITSADADQYMVVVIGLKKMV